MNLRRLMSCIVDFMMTIDILPIVGVLVCLTCVLLFILCCSIEFDRMRTCKEERVHQRYDTLGDE
jgi:hypothetical protein